LARMNDGLAGDSQGKREVERLGKKVEI